MASWIYVLQARVFEISPQIIREYEFLEQPQLLV